MFVSGNPALVVDPVRIQIDSSHGLMAGTALRNCSDQTRVRIGLLFNDFCWLATDRSAFVDHLLASFNRNHRLFVHDGGPLAWNGLEGERLSLNAFAASGRNPSAVIVPPPGLSARRPYLTTSCRWPMADRTRTATSAASAPSAMSGGLPNNSASAGRSPWAPTGGRSGDQAGGAVRKSGALARETALGPNFAQPRNSNRGSESRKSQNSVELTG